MSNLPALISDLALILTTAGVTTILFRWLKQPVVLGYIVAGFLIGPHFYLLPSVADPANISIWADIGIIFLLFALGLEFSFKKLMAVGGAAGIATAIDMCAMGLLGFALGQALGWTQMESVLLGGMISMSSTSIIIKVFSDMGLKKKKFTGIVFGMLIVEDLVAILMLVLLSTVAVGKHFEGVTLLWNVMRLIFFIVIWFVVGIFVIPSLLKRFKRFLNDEMLLIVAVGLCLGMVLFANAVGFSSALGAFIMGSILAETIESHRIEQLIAPLKNLFGAVFFISVGMMLVPEVFVSHSWTILALTLAVMLGQIVFATLGIFASGESLRDAMQGGFSLAQIGEFSFILAALGIKLGVLNEVIYPMVITVSIVTTFATPYLIRLAPPAYAGLARFIPATWTRVLNGSLASGKVMSSHVVERSKLWKGVLTSLFIYALLALAALMLARQYAVPVITSAVSGSGGRAIAAAATLLLMSPFLVGIMVQRRKQILQELAQMVSDRHRHLHRRRLVLLSLLKTATCVALIMAALMPLLAGAWHIALLAALAVIALLLYIERYGNRQFRLTDLFLKNYHEKDVHEQSSLAVSLQTTAALLHKNVHVESISIPQNAGIGGKTLAELDFKHLTGVNVLSIVRGSRRINVPGGGERVFPFDRMVVAGSDDEIQQFMQLAQQSIFAGTDGGGEENAAAQISLSLYVVEAGSPLAGRTIKELRVREKTGCMIISIDRHQQTISEVSASIALQQDDVLLLAGESRSLAGFERLMI
jgi:CPA2 family monovalent cation:H+ antiporter-2